MTSIGVRQRNRSGQVILDTWAGDTMAKVLGRTTVATGSGSLTDSRFASGTPFFFIQPAGDIAAPKAVSIAGNVLSWSGNGTASIIYGTSGGVSYPEPGRPRAGFNIRNPAGLHVIDESFFAFHLVAKGTVSGTNPIRVTMAIPSGQIPIIALSSTTGFSFVQQIQVNSATSITLVLWCSSGSVTYYAFAEAQSSLGTGIGMRWRVGNVVAGDTSIPSLRLLSTGTVYGGADWTGNFIRTIGATPSGKSYAAIQSINGYRFYQQFDAGQNGTQTAVIYSAGTRFDAGGNIYAQAQQWTSTPSGGAASDTRANASISLIDVTNF